MSRNLPTGFSDWPEDAKREFLSQARNRAETLELICDELDIEYRDERNGGRVSQEALTDVFLAL